MFRSFGGESLFYFKSINDEDFCVFLSVVRFALQEKEL